MMDEEKKAKEKIADEDLEEIAGGVGLRDDDSGIRLPHNDDDSGIRLPHNDDDSAICILHGDDDKE